MDDFDEVIDAHVAEHHVFNAEQVQRMVAEHKRIIDALEGDPVTDIHGITTYSGGMRDDLADLLVHSRNGGIPAQVQITTAQYVGLFSILATFGTAIIYLVIEVLRVT